MIEYQQPQKRGSRHYHGDNDEDSDGSHGGDSDEDGDGDSGDSDGASIKVAERPCPCSPPTWPSSSLKEIARNRLKLHEINAQIGGKLHEIKRNCKLCEERCPWLH